jgi:hypothetical protein
MTLACAARAWDNTSVLDRWINRRQSCSSCSAAVKHTLDHDRHRHRRSTVFEYLNTVEVVSMDASKITNISVYVGRAEITRA